MNPIDKYIQGLDITADELLTINTKHRHFQNCIMWHMSRRQGYSLRAVAELFQVSYYAVQRALLRMDNEMIENADPYRKHVPFVSPFRKPTPIKLKEQQIERMKKYLGIL